VRKPRNEETAKTAPTPRKIGGQRIMYRKISDKRRPSKKDGGYKKPKGKLKQTCGGLGKQSEHINKTTSTETGMYCTKEREKLIKYGR